MQTIELHIEKLVLHGFSPHHRHHIGDAVQAELSRLFSERGIPPGFTGGVQLPVINAGSFSMQPGSQPGSIGKNIAGSIYKGFYNGR